MTAPRTNTRLVTVHETGQPGHQDRRPGTGPLKQLNELGAQGWEACAQGNARTDSMVIGRVNPQVHEGHVLLLKRRKEA
jgi:hypothetical protein